MLHRLFGLKNAKVVGERVVFLDDYDLATAAWLVRGCDVWLNVPRPPLEASGTSGMKSVINGGLQLSVLDGWWAEGYDGKNGWALAGGVDNDHQAQDDRDVEALHKTLDDEVVPMFYDARRARAAGRVAQAHPRIAEDARTALQRDAACCRSTSPGLIAAPDRAGR